ncbi:hypothetical protein [Salmonella enterica]
MKYDGEHRLSVAAWEMMLKLLPAGDARRAVIERSIRLAQEK